MSEAPITADEFQEILGALDGYISEWPGTDDLIPLRDRVERIIKEMRQKELKPR